MRTPLHREPRRALALLAVIVAAVGSIATSSEGDDEDGDGSPTPDSGSWTLIESAAGTSFLLNATNLSASRGVQTTLTAPAFADSVEGTLSMEVSACVTGTDAQPARLRVLLVPEQPVSGAAREMTVAICPSSSSFALDLSSFAGCAQGVDCARGYDAVFQRVEASPAGGLSVGWSVASEAIGYGASTPPAGTVLTLTVEP